MRTPLHLRLLLCLAVLPLAATADPLTLTGDGSGNQVAAGLTPTVAGSYLTVEARFTIQFAGKTEGAGFVLASTKLLGEGATAPAIARWEEPNVEGCFGVGFDTSNPPTEDIFNADGNIYDRPQHEVSLHWNGQEMANALSPVAFEDGTPHAVLVRLRYVAAGANVTVSLDGTAIYQERFVPDMQPYECRAAFGLNPGKEQSACSFDLQGITLTDPAGEMPKPERRKVFDGAVLNAGHQTEEVTVDLPEAGKPVQRIMLTLTLGAPEGGIDPWDRGGSVYAFGDDGQRYEVLRFITPFGRAYQWKADVTDFQTLLRGKRKMAVNISTWVKGWRVDVDLDYYFGTPEREAFRVTNLWQGDFEYGNPADPMDAKFATRKLTLDPQTKSAKLRLVVTGHGMSPNTSNAAEFMPAGRTVTVNGRAFENVLWTTDNYLNPCRPQGGTWKFDRAGWGPGALVVPWELDITELATAGNEASFDYKPGAYVNENAGKGRACHIVEVVVVEYR